MRKQHAQLSAPDAMQFSFVGNGLLDSLVRGWFPEGTRLHVPAAAKAGVGGDGSEATLDFAPRADRLGLGATVAPLGGSLEGAAMSATGAGKRLAQRMLKTQDAQRQDRVDGGRAAPVGGPGSVGVGIGESDDECESRSQSISKRKNPSVPPPLSKRAKKRAKQAAAAARAAEAPAAPVADGAPLTKNQRRKQRKREAAAKLKAEQDARQAAQLAAQGVVR